MTAELDNNNDNISGLIEECRTSSDVDRRTKILVMLNLRLDPAKRLHIPSLITSDYVNRAAEIIEESLLIENKTA